MNIDLINLLLIFINSIRITEVAPFEEDIVTNNNKNRKTKTNNKKKKLITKLTESLTDKPSDKSEGSEDVAKPILMVKTENVIHEPFERTEEFLVWNHEYEKLSV